MTQPEWIITPLELKKCLDRVTLVDVREPEEHAESRIEGCKLIPLGELSSRGARELNPEDDIVVYCAHGIRSMRGIQILRERHGYRSALSLRGGVKAWEP